jgi:hypothetical protein
MSARGEPTAASGAYVTIWGVRSGDQVYVRSAYGPDNGWYRRALGSHAGRIRAGDAERDVTFEPVGADMRPALDAAYHAKYDRYGDRIVGAVVDDTAAGTTLRVVPAD